MAEFVMVDRKTTYLLPPSVEDFLSEDQLARLIVDVTDQLDSSELTIHVERVNGRGPMALRCVEFPQVIQESQLIML